MADMPPPEIAPDPIACPSRDVQNNSAQSLPRAEGLSKIKNSHDHNHEQRQHQSELHNLRGSVIAGPMTCAPSVLFSQFRLRFEKDVLIPGEVKGKAN